MALATFNGVDRVTAPKGAVYFLVNVTHSCGHDGKLKFGGTVAMDTIHIQSIALAQQACHWCQTLGKRWRKERA